MYKLRTGVSMADKIDIRTYYERKKGWWIEERATVHCVLPKDGLLAVFRREDIEELMDREYPHVTRPNNEKVWYFNETRDREIAEIDPDNRIACNPQVLLEHFMKREQ